MTVVLAPIPIPFIKRRETRVLADNTQVFIGLLDDQFKKTYTSYAITQSNQITHRAFSKGFHTLDLVDSQARRLLDLLSNPIVLSGRLTTEYSLLDRERFIRDLITADIGDRKLSRDIGINLDIIEDITHTASNRPAAQVRSLVGLDYQDIQLEHRNAIGNYEESAEDTYSAFDQELAAINEQRQSITEMLEALGAESDDTADGYQGDELFEDGSPMSESEFDDYQEELNSLIDSLAAELGSLDDYADELQELIQAGRIAQASRASGGRSTGGGAGGAGLSSLFDMGGGGSFGGLDGLFDGGGGGGGGGGSNDTFITFFDEYMSDFANSFDEYFDAESTSDSKANSFFGKQPRGEKGQITRSKSAKKSQTGAGLANRRSNSQQKTNKFIDDVGSYYSVREINVIKYFLLDGHISNTTWSISHSIAISHVLNNELIDIKHEFIEYLNTILYGLWVANAGNYEILDRDFLGHLLNTERFEKDQVLLDRDTAYHSLDAERFEKDQVLLDRDTSYYSLDLISESLNSNLLNRPTESFEILGLSTGDYQVYVREVIPQSLINGDQGDYQVKSRFTYSQTLITSTISANLLLARDTTNYLLDIQETSNQELLARDTTNRSLDVLETSNQELLARDTTNYSLDVSEISNQELLARDTADHELVEIHNNQNLLYTREIIEFALTQIVVEQLLLYIREQIDIELLQISIEDHLVSDRDTSNRSQTTNWEGDHATLARDTSNHELSEIIEASHEIYYSNHVLIGKVSISIDLVDHVQVGISERENWLRDDRVVNDRSMWLGRS